MQISDEAVDAAADMIVQGDRGACECRRSIFDKHDVNPPCSTRRQAIRTARAALDAAAPHMPSDLEVFVRMFDEFAVNLRASNTTDDPNSEGQAEAYTFAARQLRVALTNPYRSQS